MGNEVVQEQEKGNERIIKKTFAETSEKRTGEEKEERVGRKTAQEELKNFLNRIKEKEEVYFYEIRELIEKAKKFLDPDIFGEEVFKAFLEKLDATLEGKNIIYNSQELNKLINLSSELKRVRKDLSFYEGLLSHPLFVIYSNKREWTTREIHRIYESIRKIAVSREDIEEIVREVLHGEGISLQERKAEFGEEDMEKLVGKVKELIQEDIHYLLERLLEEKFRQTDKEELVFELKEELLSWFEEKIAQAKEELRQDFEERVGNFEAGGTEEELKESIKEEILRELREEGNFSYMGEVEIDGERFRDTIREEVSYFFEQEWKEILKEEIKGEIISWIGEQGGIGHSEPLKVDIEGLLERVQRLEEKVNEQRTQVISKSEVEEREVIKKDLFGSSEEGDKEEDIFSNTMQQEGATEQTTTKGKKGKKKDNFILYAVVGGLMLILLILLLL